MALVVAATAAAFLERWWFPYAWHEQASPGSVFYYGDATRFIDYALAIAQGRVYDNGIPFHPPGWPLMLAMLFRWTGTASTEQVAIPVIKLLTALLSSLSIGVATMLAGEIAGLGALVAVAILGPFDFGHMVEGSVANSEALYGLLVTLTAWSSWRWLREGAVRPRAWAALTAMLSGAAMLVRAEFMAAVVVLVAFAWVQRRRPIDAAVYIAIAGIVLAPTTLWHWRTLSTFNDRHVGRVAGPLPRFAPVTSYGPFNFAMANHEEADGGPNRDHPMLDRCQDDTGERLEAGQLDLACPAIYDLYVNGYSIGGLWLLNNPGAALTLMARKILFTAGFLGQGFLADDLGVGVDGVRRRVDLIDPTNGWLTPVRLLLAVTGLAVLRRRPTELAVITAPLTALTGSVLLFYGYVRLGTAYLPIVLVLIGIGLASWLYRATARLAARDVALLALAVIALGAAYDRTMRDRDRAVIVDGARSERGAVQSDETVNIRRP